MISHIGWVHALPFGRAVRILSLAWLGTSFLQIDPVRTAHAEPAKSKPEEVDTEHMFGFTEGSEIGEKGETEFMSESTGRFGEGGRLVHTDREPVRGQIHAYGPVPPFGSR